MTDDALTNDALTEDTLTNAAMKPAVHDTRTTRGRGSGLRLAGRDLAAGFSATLVVALITRRFFDLPASYLLHAVSMYMLLAGLILWRLPGYLPGPGLGAANRVTLGRAAMVLPLAALALQPAILGTAGAWWIIAVSTVAMILDSVDGWIARRTGTTPFGARFDMELDAFLILALSVLVWQSGQAGAWVLLIGALRYLFVAAGWVWPALTAELPPSRRRQTVCVVQGVVLLLCLTPVVPSVMASVVAVVALGLLSASFAVDVRWLARRAAGR